MQTNTENVRAPRSQFILWKWTGVSAVLHAVLLGALCGWSYLGFAKREAASKAKAAQEEAAAKKAEADEAAKTPPAPANAAAPAKPVSTTGSSVPADSGVTAEKIATPPATPEIAPPAAASAPVQAEKVLGIDKVAKPEETPKSPFAGKDDDLLKDLK